MRTHGDSIDVLHVDDEPDFADLAATFLEREDDRINVETATSASQGLELLANGIFDCVVSDYNMPGENGIEFLEAVREDRPDLPFLLFTGKGSEEVASEAISSGVTDYLQKGSSTSQYTVLANRIRNSVDNYRAQTKLADREQRLNLFFEQSPLGVIQWDENFEFVRLNEAAEEILGYDEADLAGQSWEVIVPDVDQDAVDGVVSDLLDNQGGFHSTNENVRADGERIVCEWHNRVVTDNGDIVAIFSQFQDVSEREAHEQALRSRESRFRKIAESATDAVLTIDADSIIRFANPAVERVFGYPPGELMGEPLTRLMPERHRDRHLTAIDQYIERGEPSIDWKNVEFPGRHRDGHEIDLQISFSAFEQDGEPRFSGIIRDVTEKKQRVETLTHQQSLLTAVMETSIDGILVVDQEREYVTWNLRFIEMWGVPEDLIGDKPEEMGLEWALDRLEDPAEFIDQVEYLYEHPDEESRDEVHLTDGRVFDRYSAPVRDVDGIHYGRVWYFRDVTEQYQRQQRLRQQNDRLEQFAKIVSHDLRNPLSIAQGRLELVSEDVESEHIPPIRRAHERMHSLINDLLTLAREGRGGMDATSLNLANLVEACWENVETEDATLAIEASRSIQADESRLSQLVENLIRNAVEHGGADVTVTIGSLDDGFFVEDDGPGIPPAERGQVFETGFSTSDAGIGFGLSIVEQVAVAHGWDVRVTEGQAGGARFEITGVEFS